MLLSCRLSAPGSLSAPIQGSSTLAPASACEAWPGTPTSGVGCLERGKLPPDRGPAGGRWAPSWLCAMPQPLVGGMAGAPREAAGSCTPLYLHAAAYSQLPGLWGCGGGTALSPSFPGSGQLCLRAAAAPAALCSLALACRTARPQSCPGSVCLVCWHGEQMPAVPWGAGTHAPLPAGLSRSVAPRAARTGVQGGRGRLRQAVPGRKQPALGFPWVAGQPLPGVALPLWSPTGRR